MSLLVLAVLAVSIIASCRTEEEQILVKSWTAAGKWPSAIAELLGKNKSTITRFLKRSKRAKAAPSVGRSCALSPKEIERFCEYA